MAWNGSGVFVLNQDFGADRDTGAPDHFIQADDMDDEFGNVKAGLEACLTRNGETVPSATTPWGSQRISNLADATAATDAVNRQFADARFAALAGSTLTGALLVDSGTVAAPGLAFDAEADCGLYYIGANNIGFSIAGSKRQEWTTSGTIITGTLGVTGDPSSGSEVGDREYNDARYCLESNNLSDLTNAGTARSNLSLGTIATQASNSVSITGGSVTGITDLAVADGGTGSSVASGARSNLVIGNFATASGSVVRTLTVGTSAATGGVAGDVHFRYS